VHASRSTGRRQSEAPPCVHRHVTQTHYDREEHPRQPNPPAPAPRSACTRSRSRSYTAADDRAIIINRHRPLAPITIAAKSIQFTHRPVAVKKDRKRNGEKLNREIPTACRKLLISMDLAVSCTKRPGADVDRIHARVVKRNRGPVDSPAITPASLMNANSPLRWPEVVGRAGGMKSTFRPTTSGMAHAMRVPIRQLSRHC